MDKNELKKEPIGAGVFINVSKNHTFGTDAILLADFAHPKKSDKCIDLGTGCGIIPFLMLRNNPERQITGVEISKEAADLAALTAKENHFDNFSVINANLTELKGKTKFGKYTLVTCNPPYKADGAGIKSKSSSDLVARHETACTLDDIISVSAKLLQTSGRLCMCLRPERLAELFATMQKYKIEPKRLRTVSKLPETEPWLILAEGKKCAKSGITVEKGLFIEDGNGNFSPEMIEIYGSYKEAYL